MTITLTKAIRVAGGVVPAGTTVTYAADLEADLVQRGHATYAAGSPSFPGREVPVMASTSSSKRVGKIAFYGSVRSSVPFVLCGSMSLVGGGSGAFTLSAAILAGLGVGLAGSPAFFYLPANAAGSGCSAGWYYGQFSGDTAGTIYADTYKGGNPSDSIPAVPTAFVGAPAVTTAVTQTTAEVPTITGYVLPPNFLSRDADLAWTYKIYGDAVGLKSYRLKIGSTVALYDSSSAAQDGERCLILSCNGATNRQQASRSSSGIGVSATSLSADFLSIDTSVEQALSLTMQLGAAGASAVLGRYKIRLED